MRADAGRRGQTSAHGHWPSACTRAASTLAGSPVRSLSLCSAVARLTHAAQPGEALSLALGLHLLVIVELVGEHRNALPIEQPHVAAPGAAALEHQTVARLAEPLAVHCCASFLCACVRTAPVHARQYAGYR